MAFAIHLFTAIFVVFLGCYYYFKSRYRFWSDQGVEGPKPIVPFGNFKDFLFGRVSIGSYIWDIYKEYKTEPIVGLYNCSSPIAMINDPDLIRDILIKDFSKFSDRGQSVNERVEPLSAHLFNLEPERWKPLRAKLSPIFTSGKLKEMYHLITQCSDKLEKYMTEEISDSKDIESRDLAARYTTDIIGSCAFGIDMNAISKEENEFRKVGTAFFTLSFSQLLRRRAAELIPTIYNFLGYVIPYTSMTKFFCKIVSENIDYRKTHKIVRHDFIDLLLELKENPNKLGLEMTTEFLTAQALVFFLAGFETSASAMSNTLYELALDHKIQEKLRSEIKGAIAKSDGTPKIEEIKDLKYLDAVFKETLRKYPPVTILKRKSTEPYTFNGTKVSIPKGTSLLIPVLPMHRDPDIFPDPDVYNPDRFLESESKSRHSMHYLPFGDGPRNCIGARFALYQTKVGLITILKNFKVDICERTPRSYVLDPKMIVLAPVNGLPLKFSRLTSNE